MQCLVLDNSDFNKWNDFVDISPQGSIYGKTWYLDALGVDYKILAVISSNEILGGIVLTKNEIKCYSNPLLCKYLGLYFKPFQGKRFRVLSNEIKVANVILDKVKKIATFDYFFHPSFTNWLPFYWEKYKQQIYYTYVIDFRTSTLGEIYENFDPKLRSHIKVAEKEGVEIVEDVDFDTFLRINEKTFLRQGSSSPFSTKKLKDFMDKLKKRDSIKSFGALNESKNITAVSAIVYDNKRANLILNGIDVDNIKSGTNDLLIYKTIQFASGISECFDFEGSMIKPIESFYRKFGCELIPYMRIWKDNLFNYFKFKALRFYKKIKYGK